MGIFNKENLERIRAEEAEQHKYSILIVDDEQDNLVTLSNALSDHYRVVTAVDGREALTLIQGGEEHFQIIISDQRMPNLTGVEFLERSLSITPQTKRIILSGFADVEAVIAAINKARIHEFILKPVENQKLLLTVRRALEAFELEQRNTQLLDELKKFNMELERKVEERTFDLEKALSRLEELATTDQLTGAYNRRKFEEIASEEIKRADRYELPLSLIAFDIDFFKRVNDVFGHLNGDMVLRDVTAMVRGDIRESDALVRWGGEEFIVLSPETGLDEAVEQAEKIRRKIAAHRFGEVGSITVSLGVAGYRAGEEIDSLIKRADDALYSAKSNGRNRVEREAGVTPGS
jgi:diguanylate cyclase (GGDEF)-like protein